MLTFVLGFIIISLSMLALYVAFLTGGRRSQSPICKDRLHRGCGKHACFGCAREPDKKPARNSEQKS